MYTHLVARLTRVCPEWLHYDVSVQEVGGYHIGYKRCVLLLIYDRYDVVAYMTLPLQLKSTVIIMLKGTEQFT